jgi:cytochrome bd-type quinol oxidase subunit 2
MSVIGPSCRVPCDGSPGCGCVAPREIEKIGTKAAATASVAAASASVTALAAAACTACCVLPFTLPAALLALVGGSIAVLDHAHLWVTRLAVAAVIAAWLWIIWQRRKTQRPIARTTMALMIAASLLTIVAASWPWIEPGVFKTLGIVKKKAVSPNG